MKTLMIFTATIAATATIFITEKISEIKREFITLKSDLNKINNVKFELIDLQQKINLLSNSVKSVSENIDWGISENIEKLNDSVEKIAWDLEDNVEKITEKVSKKVEKEATRVILTPLTVHFPQVLKKGSDKSER